MPPYKHLKRYRQIVGVLMDEGFDNTLDVLGLRRFAPVKSRLHGDRDEAGEGTGPACDTRWNGWDRRS